MYFVIHELIVKIAKIVEYTYFILSQHLKVKIEWQSKYQSS